MIELTYPLGAAAPSERLDGIAFLGLLISGLAFVLDHPEIVRASSSLCVALWILVQLGIRN